MKAELEGLSIVNTTEYFDLIRYKEETQKGLTNVYLEHTVGSYLSKVNYFLTDKEILEIAKQMNEGLSKQLREKNEEVIELKLKLEKLEAKPKSILRRLINLKT